MRLKPVHITAYSWLLQQVRIHPVPSTAHLSHIHTGYISNLAFTREMASLKKKIGTHNGCFHCDEAMAVSMLMLLSEFKDAEVIRTRDEAILATCDAVVDVGGVFDPERMRFDHHQNEFNEYFDEKHTVTRLSSAGLVYKYFGKRVIREIYGVTEEANVEEVYQQVYNRFIEALDAIDNGVAVADSPLKYENSTHLPARIARLNPSWVDENVDVDARFRDAMKLTLSEFDYYVRNAIDVHLSAIRKFEELYRNRFNVHQSGLVIETPRGMPFSHTLYQLEEKEGTPADKRLAFYITYDSATNQYRCSCIKEKDSQFASRRPFPKRLSGLRDKELEKASGIPGLTFIHRAGFTCGGLTKESILKLIDITLQES
ncbi:metal binding protein, putative [Babesia ovis]|uniref:Metal binding protein, putative n=1 Tax=Babesia ovis TaxID=5869 RepID=A0A9W5TD68_BABOV|nr:metal binding protein, putative [Babesia ovis]